MANSPSETWENGVLVSRNAETNRWKILPDGTAVEDAGDETTTKAVSASKTENKSVKAASKKS